MNVVDKLDVFWGTVWEQYLRLLRTTSEQLELFEQHLDKYEEPDEDFMVATLDSVPNTYKRHRSTHRRHPTPNRTLQTFRLPHKKTRKTHKKQFISTAQTEPDRRPSPAQQRRNFVSFREFSPSDDPFATKYHELEEELQIDDEKWKMLAEFVVETIREIVLVKKSTKQAGGREAPNRKVRLKLFKGFAKRIFEEDEPDTTTDGGTRSISKTIHPSS
ncbi:hypothetical protein HDV00_008848 [Rhizophlyctis rosea]|nr:hypothetical protein HDV00_008848 [Rhizophlyctis rosea]